MNSVETQKRKKFKQQLKDNPFGYILFGDAIEFADDKEKFGAFLKSMMKKDDKKDEKL